MGFYIRAYRMFDGLRAKSFRRTTITILVHLTFILVIRVHTTLVTFSYLVISDRIRRNGYPLFLADGNNK